MKDGEGSFLNFKQVSTRRCCAALLFFSIFVAGGARAEFEAPDLLTRASDLAARAESVVWKQLGTMMLSRQWAGQPGRTIAKALALGEGEILHLLDVSGRVYFSSDPYLTTRNGYRFPGSEQLARREFFNRALAEPRGAGSYRAISLGGGDIVRRELAWVDLNTLGRAWVLVYEREDSVAAHYSDEPLTGKWLGAYSMKGYMVFSEGAAIESWKDAGQISGMIMQNGAQCIVRLFSNRWQMEGAGLVVSNHLRIGEARVVPYADDEVWLFDADYDEEFDQIRGTVRVVGPRVVTERAIFMERLPPH